MEVGPWLDVDAFFQLMIYYGNKRLHLHVDNTMAVRLTG